MNNEKNKILIIGHKGSYGVWLNQILSKGFVKAEIKGIDQEETRNIADFTSFVREADIIFSVVSLDSSMHIIKFVSEYARKESLIIDLSSSKKEVHPLLVGAKSDFLMLHPMCTPPKDSKKILKENRVYAINTYQLKNPKNALFYTHLKEVMGGDFVGISLEDHDIVDEMQATSHNMLVAFSAFVVTVLEKNDDMDYEKIKRYSTPVSKPLFSAMERFLKNGNPETTAKLIELAIKNQSIPFMAANKSVLDNRSIRVYRFVEKLTKRIARIKKKIFG